MRKDIMFVLDDNYVQQFLVTIHSIFENNVAEEITVHVIHEGLKKENQKIMSDYVLGNGAKLIFYQGNKELLNTDIMISSNWPSIIYYKIYGIFHLQDISKVLCLDCDLIVDKNLDELFKIPIEDYYVLAVEDTGLWQVFWDHREHLRKLRLPDDYKYVNSGVMMLNLRAIREETTFEEIMQKSRLYGNRWNFWEQDLINMLWKDKIKVIDNKYNRIATDFQYRKKIYKDKQTVIFHYTMPKPWSDQLKKKKRIYLWCVKKYLKYANFEDCKELRNRILSNYSIQNRIKGFIKSKFGIMSEQPYKSGRMLDFILYKW